MSGFGWCANAKLRQLTGLEVSDHGFCSPAPERNPRQSVPDQLTLARALRYARASS